MIVVENSTIQWHEDACGHVYQGCTIIIDADQRILRNTVFKKCVFEFEQKVNFDIRDCEFIGCDLSLQGFEDSHISRVSFMNCKLMSFMFHNCYIRELSILDSMAQYFAISTSKLRTALFQNTEFRSASFMALDHQLWTLEDCLLDDCNFQDTSLKGLDLSSCDFNALVYSPHLLRGLKVRPDQALIFAIQMGLIIE